MLFPQLLFFLTSLTAHVLKNRTVAFCHFLSCSRICGFNHGIWFRLIIFTWPGSFFDQRGLFFVVPFKADAFIFGSRMSHFFLDMAVLVVSPSCQFDGTICLFEALVLPQGGLWGKLLFSSGPLSSSIFWTATACSSCCCCCRGRLTLTPYGSLSSFLWNNNSPSAISFFFLLVLSF